MNQIYDYNQNTTKQTKLNIKSWPVGSELT